MTLRYLEMIFIFVVFKFEQFVVLNLIFFLFSGKFNLVVLWNRIPWGKAHCLLWTTKWSKQNKQKSVAFHLAEKWEFILHANSITSFKYFSVEHFLISLLQPHLKNIHKNCWTKVSPYYNKHVWVFCFRHLEGATPSPHQAGCHLWAKNLCRLLPPPSFQPGPLQSPQRGRHPGQRGSTNPSLPGRLPHAILLAWWMKLLLSRTSSTTSPPTCAWQPSAKYCQSRRPSGRSGPPTSPRRKHAATPGAKAVVRFELRCRHLCLQQGAASPVLPVLRVTGLCPGSGGLRGLGRGPIRALRCPTLRASRPQGSKFTSLCTPATPGAGGDRI